MRFISTKKNLTNFKFNPTYIYIKPKQNSTCEFDNPQVHFFNNNKLSEDSRW